ncbi:recombinase RecT [Paenibacillus larvae]|uniref:recombinase RecT n=1 Tax=Paenibacillus larvae TaxID=1464 RepID=UPI00227E99E3|nr:recombinase RecT [Paenibacillus larvae]MCY9508506.1 recombinase RecT [Paenibacillus larvae]MCY9527491.1 recombinase RecT [Paenibacillus larvae]
MAKKVDQSNIANQLAAKTGKEVVPEEKPKSVFELIQSMEKEFKRALPDHIGHERFVRIAMTVVRTNPKLMQCEAMSIIAALMQSAQLGLEPNTPTKEAHLIPYSNKRIINGKEIWVDEAQFQMGYRGILKLVWQSGIVSEIDCDSICRGDTVIYEKGKDGTFKHIPVIDGERGEPYAYYAYAVTKDGGFVCTVMSKDQVLKHALKFSKSKKRGTGELYGPWKDDFDAMALKTVLIALCDKKLPKSSALQQQIAQDSTIKREVSEDMSEVVDVTDYTILGEEQVSDDESAVQPDPEA